MADVIHKGLWATCRVCNPASVNTEKRKWRKAKVTGSTTADVYIRRQVAAELGEDEPTKEEKFSLLQKYGVTPPRIDRRVTKPHWKSETEWKRQLAEFYKATKGLVPQTSMNAARRSSTLNRPQNLPARTVRAYPKKFRDRPQDMRTSHRSYGQGRTENRPR